MFCTVGLHSIYKYTQVGMFAKKPYAMLQLTHQLVVCHVTRVWLAYQQRHVVMVARGKNEINTE